MFKELPLDGSKKHPHSPAVQPRDPSPATGRTPTLQDWQQLPAPGVRHRIPKKQTSSSRDQHSKNSEHWTPETSRQQRPLATRRPTQPQDTPLTRMTDPLLVDQMTRLKLKLLEKKLENERLNSEELNETPMATARSYDGQEDALQSALLRRKDLLQKLREQHMLEELTHPQTWGGSRRKNYRLDPIQQAPPIQVYQAPAPPPPAEPPRIIQQQWPPQQPATIIQQLPPQQPLITQIPAPQAFQPPRSGSIKEDMVEMMLMQNAQMHQIIMQNMMLKALPPMGFPQAGGAVSPGPQHQQQDHQYAAPVVVRTDRPRPSSVHHHHHYSPPGAPPGPTTMPSFGGYQMWPQMMPSNPMGQAAGFSPAVHHMTGPTATIPAAHTFE